MANETTSPLIIKKETVRKSNGVSLEVLALRKALIELQFDGNLHPSDVGSYWKSTGQYTVPTTPWTPRGDFVAMELVDLFRNTSGHEIFIQDEEGTIFTILYSGPIYIYKPPGKEFVFRSSSEIGKWGRFYYIRGILEKLGVVIEETGVITSDTSEDAYVSKLGKIVSKLHTEYFRKCHALVAHLNEGAKYAFWPFTKDTTADSKVKFDIDTDEMIYEIRKLATWTYDLHIELQSFENSQLYVVEELVKNSAYEIERQKNGDLRVTVKSPKDLIQIYFKFLHEGKMKLHTEGDGDLYSVDWSDSWKNTFLEMAPSKYKYLWKETLETTKVAMTLEKLLGLTIERQSKFLTDTFDITESQVQLLAYYVNKCHESSLSNRMSDMSSTAPNLRGTVATSLNVGETYRYSPSTSSHYETATVTKKDLDAVYKVVSQMSGKNLLLGDGDPSNGWLLGFNQFSKKYDTFVMRNVRPIHPSLREPWNQLGPSEAWDSGAVIPGMIEFTGPTGDVYVSYNYGKGRDHWFRSKDLPCGNRGWIWKDRNLNAYVFCWKHRNATTEKIDMDAMAPFLIQQPGGRYKIKAMGLLEELWKYPPKDKMEKINGKWYYIHRGQRHLALNYQRQSSIRNSSIDWSYKTEE
jgi:hypothetical protein